MSFRDALPPEIPVGGMPTRSGSVTRVLLLSTLVALAIVGLTFQLGIGDTVFARPGELMLLFIDVAPVLWFAAAAVLLTTFRWQSIDQRFRWVMLAALGAVGVSIVVRLVAFEQSVPVALLEPFTLGFLAIVAGAVAFTRTRVRRLAQGTDAGITLRGIGIGFSLAGTGLAIGTLRVAFAGPLTASGTVARSLEFAPTTGLLSAATLLMVGGLFVLADRTRNR